MCKYLGKFNEGNYVILYEYIHTREWVLGKTNFHNAKITTSQINKYKDFSNDKNKNCPKGRDMIDLEII